MHIEARKLYLIQAILSIENGAILDALEAIVKLDVPANKAVKARFSDRVWSLTEEEAESMRKAIAENFEKINPDDWK